MAIRKVDITSAEVSLLVREYNKQATGLVPNRTGDDDMDEYICPNCCHYLSSLDYYEISHIHFCSNCGQKLDWKDAFNRGRIVKRSEYD